MAREINLVPDIKGEMIKTLKLRNFIFFLCIVVASASVAVTVMAGLIMGGQQAAVDGKKATINTLSNKLNSYADLNDFLTIKDQLGSIATLTEKKQVLSRTFGVLSALIPTGPDVITISELNVDLSQSSPTFMIEAQADAKKDPFIDYNVLESFKKSMQYMQYDYGDYVDKEGNTIPAYCMIENGPDGALFNDPERGDYAFWRIYAKGCNPSAKTASNNTSEEDDADKTEGSSESVNDTSLPYYDLENYGEEVVVRIWRTPQFQSWYKEKPVDNEPYITENGEIGNVEHFKSACITYTADKSQGDSAIKWNRINEECHLVPGGTDGINIGESSNGRDAEHQLVLRFSATITLDPAVFNFNYHHMMALPPSGHHNVTDSYVQIQAMFGERATDCSSDDKDCESNKTNEDGDKTDTNGGNQNG